MAPLFKLISLFASSAFAFSASDACSALQGTSLNARISLKSAPAYDQSLDSYYSTQETNVKPSCVVHPQSVQEVSQIVKILGNRFAAAGNKRQGLFAVRSGGHTPWPGSANIRDGATVDLRSLNTIELSQDQKTVTIGTGSTWGDVYSYLEAQNLTVVGGRASHVGVGGLSLGGGLSHLSPRYGFVTDNIIRYRIVLASGEVTEASATCKSDLFRALKGGSSNFGIVTHFTFATVPFGAMWGGTTYYSIENAPRLLDAHHEFTSNPNYDVDATIITAVGSLNGVVAVAVKTQYLQPLENPPAFKAFADVKHLFSTTRITSLHNLSVDTAKETPGGRRELFKTTTIHSDRDLLDFGVKAYNDSLQPLKDIKGLVYSIVYQPLPTVITHKNQNADVLGLDDAPVLQNVLITCSWDDSAKDAVVYAQTDKLLHAIDAEATRRNLLHSFKYLNYAWGNQDPISGYGISNVNFLKATARKYDPAGFFQVGMPGGFKLFAKTQVY